METLISAVTEKTRLYLFNAYEPFNFNFLLLVIEKTLVVTTNLSKPESARLLSSSRPEVFCKKSILKNFTKFTGKHLCQSLFVNKVAGLRYAALLKQRF